MSFQRATPGQSLSIRADDWNRVRDAARDYYASRNTGKPGEPPLASDSEHNVVWIKNTTENDAPRGGALGLDGPVWEPEDQGDAFGQQIAFKGVAPTEEHAGRFAVLIEPIAAGQVGRGVLAGVVAATVEVVDAAHRFAAIGERTDESVGLISAPLGPLEILWRDEPDQDGLAMSVARWGSPQQSASVRMVVKEQFNDYLRCRRVIETEQGVFSEGDTDILVAKPPKLRHDAGQYPGVSSLTTTSASEVEAGDETWVAHWPYTVGDHIYASKPQGGAGVWVGDEQLVWLDDNRDGRVWRLVEEED